MYVKLFTQCLAIDEQYLCVCVCVCVCVLLKYSSLCYTVGPCLSILYMIVCIIYSQTLYFLFYVRFGSFFWRFIQIFLFGTYSFVSSFCQTFYLVSVNQVKQLPLPVLKRVAFFGSLPCVDCMRVLGGFGQPASTRVDLGCRRVLGCSLLWSPCRDDWSQSGCGQRESKVCYTQASLAGWLEPRWAQDGISPRGTQTTALAWCLQPWRESQQFPVHFDRYFQLSNWISFPYRLGALSTAIFSLYPRVGKSALGPFSYTPLTSGHCGRGGFPVDTMSTSFLFISVWSLYVQKLFSQPSGLLQEKLLCM